MMQTDSHKGQHDNSLLDGLNAEANQPKKPARSLKLSPAAKKRGLIAAVSLACVGGITWSAVEFWPTPKPDFEFAPLDDVFGFALLTDDFNNLPIEERIELVAAITDRLQNMQGDDSLLLAAFAAGIMGEARAQLEENISRLMLDAWDMHAVGYNNVPLEDREAYLEQAVIDMVRLGDGITGLAGDKTDDEVLDTAFEQARRDQEVMSDSSNGPSVRGKARLFNFMNNTVGSNASPQQRARLGLFIRDVSAHLRGGG